MKKSTQRLYEKVFANESILHRRFSLDKLEDSLEEDPDKISLRFEEKAVELSARSLQAALRELEMDPRELDYLAVSTCTGYLCPGLSTRLIEACGLRKDVRCLDVVGMGCGSAVPALEQAHNFIAAHPEKTAASVSTEICSAAMYNGDSPDLVISNAIFADGSAAAVLGNSKSAGSPDFHTFSSLTYPEWQESLRFRTEKGRLRNVLAKEVPEQVREAVMALIEKLLAEQGLKQDDIRHWIFHAGGEKVLDAVQGSLKLSDAQMRRSRDVLKNHGNLSSPTVLYGLKNLLLSDEAAPGDWGILTSYGAGFSAHACLVKF